MLTNEELEAAIASLAQRKTSGRGIGLKQVKALIAEVASTASGVTTNAGAVPTILASGTTTASGVLTLSGKEAYVIAEAVSSIGFGDPAEAVTITIDDGCAVILVQLNTAADSLRLACTHLIRINGPVTYTATVSSGTPAWKISLIWTR